VRKYTIFVALLATAIFVSGCSDDDNAAGLAGGEETLVIGQVLVRPYIDFSIDIFPVYGQGNQIDSIRFGDSTCEIYPSYYYNFFGTEYLYTATYYKRSDSLRYHSGSEVPITFFDNAQRSVVDVRLLHFEDDTLKYLLPPEEYAANRGETVEFVWSRVPNADWYGLLWWYEFDSSETYAYRDSIIWTTDTSIVVDGSILTHNGRIQVWGSSMAGPIPGSTPNVSGLKITGSIYSRSLLTAKHVTVGSGLPSTTTPETSAEPDDLVSRMVADLYRLR
jgi:hypothetical protein